MLSGYRIGFLLGVLFISVLVLVNAMLAPPLERLETQSYLVTDKRGEGLRAFPTGAGRWRLPAKLEEIDPHFIDALVRVEDKRFYQHFGVDYVALGRASVQAMLRGRINSGASTLSMQLARLLEPRPRTFKSKLIEIIRAHQIELRLSKREILEAYLTLAPYGGNLEGIKAASYAWFGKTPLTLTDSEIALLLALPQAPEGRRPDRRPQSAKRARDKLAMELVKFEFWTEARGVDVAGDPIENKRYAMPNRAWHASRRLWRQWQETANFAAPASLNSQLQSGTRAILERHIKGQPKAVQAGAILVEIPSRCVVAYVGSLSRDRAGGWLDLMARPRSPGSTLKPFIYGLGIDRGLVRSNSLLTDFPTSFGGYSPENFDKGFRGDVRMSDALQYSLNIPAVQVLDSFGAENLNATFDFAGVSLRLAGRDKRPTGLSLALGAVGISGVQLAQLYAGLGGEGRTKPLRWHVPCDRDVSAQAKAVLSPETSRQILDILRDAPAPQGRSPAHLTRTAPQIAHKTGTSYGYRDAWAAGVAGDLAAVVWVGRADGAPNGNATGRATALPILFDLVDLAYSMPPFGKGISQTNRSFAVQDRSAKTSLKIEAESSAPKIVFPPKSGTLFISSKTKSSYVLAAHAQTAVQWYVDGVMLKPDPLGQAVWSPKGVGFYKIAVVDAVGYRDERNVRVKAFDSQ